VRPGQFCHCSFCKWSMAGSHKKRLNFDFRGFRPLILVSSFFWWAHWPVLHIRFVIMTMCAAVIPMPKNLSKILISFDGDDLDTYWHRLLTLLAANQFSEVDLFGHAWIFSSHPSNEFAHGSSPPGCLLAGDGLGHAIIVQHTL